MNWCQCIGSSVGCSHSSGLIPLCARYRTLVRSWYLRGCWGIELALTRETDGILWSNKAALGPLSPMQLRAAGTKEPVWVSLDWKSCCSNTLSLAAGHKAHTCREGGKHKGKRSNSIGWKSGWKRIWRGEKERKKDRKMNNDREKNQWRSVSREDA